MKSAIHGLIGAIGLLVACSVGPSDENAVGDLPGVSWFGPIAEIPGGVGVPTHLLARVGEGPRLLVNVRPRSIRDLDGAVIAVATVHSAEFLSLLATAMTEGMQVEVLAHHRATPSEGAVGVIESGSAELSRAWFDDGYVDGVFDASGWALRVSAEHVLVVGDGFDPATSTARGQLEPLPQWAKSTLQRPQAATPRVGSMAPPPEEDSRVVPSVDRQHIELLDASTGVARRIGAGGAGRGEFLGIVRVRLHDGDLFAADGVRQRVQVFALDGRWKAELPAPGQPSFGHIVDLALGANGTLWVLDADQGRVVAMTPDGVVLGAVGGGAGLADDQLRGPERLRIEGEAVVVWDPLLQRETRFEMANLSRVDGPPVKSTLALGALAPRGHVRDLRPLAKVLAKSLGLDAGTVSWFDDHDAARVALSEGRVDLLLASGALGLQLDGAPGISPVAVFAEGEPADVVVVSTADSLEGGLLVATSGPLTNASHLAPALLAPAVNLVDAGSDATALAWLKTGRVARAVVSSRALSPDDGWVEITRSAALLDGVVLSRMGEAARLRDALLAVESEAALGTARIDAFEAYDAASPLVQATKATSEVRR